MIAIYIKRILLLVVCSILISSVSAQVTKTDYFMKTSYMKTFLNPALRPDQGQLIVPIIPTIGIGAQTNSLNLDNLTFKNNGKRVTFLHPSVSNDQFLSGLSSDNYLNTDVNMKLFMLSKYIGDKYWSLDVGMRVHAEANLPKSVFELLKVGFDEGKAKTYDLKNINAAGSAFMEIGVGHSRPFMDNTLMLGARAKMLLGAGYFDLNAKSLNITADADEWRAKSQVTLKGAAPGVKPKYDEDDQLDGFDSDWEGLPGYGAGLDIGAVYDIRKILPVLSGLKVSAALNDLGFIHWTKNNALNMISPETEVIVNPSSASNHESTSLSDVLDDAFNDIKESINLREVGNRKAHTSTLRMNMLIGAEYEILKDKFSAGLLYSARFGNYSTAQELTVSANFQPLPWLGTSASYSFLHSDFDTFGFAFHIAPRKGLTLFFVSDYVIPHVSPQWIPTTSKGVNMLFGMSIPIGKSQSRKRVQLKELESMDRVAPLNIYKDSTVK